MLDSAGKPTLGGFGTMTETQLDLFTAYCRSLSPPIAVKVSIGGSGGQWDRTWDQLTTANTMSYAQGLVDYCHAHGLSGIDFDYEAYTSDAQQAIVGTLIKQFKTIDPNMQTSLCSNAGFGGSYPWKDKVQRVLDAATTTSASGVKNCAVDKLYIMSYYNPMADEQGWILGWSNWLQTNYGFTPARVSVGIDDFDASAYDPNVFMAWAAQQGFSTGHWAFDPARPKGDLVPAITLGAPAAVTTPPATTTTTPPATTTTTPPATTTTTPPATTTTTPPATTTTTPPATTTTTTPPATTTTPPATTTTTPPATTTTTPPVVVVTNPPVDSVSTDDSTTSSSSSSNSNSQTPPASTTTTPSTSSSASTARAQVLATAGQSTGSASSSSSPTPAVTTPSTSTSSDDSSTNNVDSSLHNTDSINVANAAVLSSANRSVNSLTMIISQIIALFAAFMFTRAVM